MKSFKFIYLLGAAVFFLGFTSCDDDDGNDIIDGNFTVTIENIMEGKDNLQSGTIGGLIMPGQSETITFQAGKGHYLSLATMFVQSNDLFYAPDDTGMALYDGDGNPVTGDVTSAFDLWDAGTEVNEMPGTGANQAPRQSGPNTGPDENGTVELVSNVNDGFTYPADEEVINVTLAHDGGTTFTLTLNNVSDQNAFQTPLAPGNWSIHGSGISPMFTEGQAAAGGLEGMAEDGNNADLEATLAANTGYVSPFAPGAYAVFQGTNPIFADGSAASAALEALAEDGDPSGYSSLTNGGIFNTPVGAGGPAPIFPGETYEFSFTATDGDMLSFVTMLVQTNDLFVGPEGISLFDNGTAISGDITAQMELWDAYTEVNEYPGAGK